jgi:ribose-phosphate pyrophosphokinase
VISPHFCREKPGTGLPADLCPDISSPIETRRTARVLRDAERRIQQGAERGVHVGQERLHQADCRQLQSALAQAIADGIGVALTKGVVRRFADMEIFVEIQENVRGSDAFILQSTSFPANDHLMELLIITDALRRSSARRITAVIPYFGYARQDRKLRLAHADLGQAGRQPDHACRRRPRHDARPACRPDPGLLRHPDRQSVRLAVMVRDIKERFDLSKVMVVSPDVGGVVRARGLAKRINTPLAIIDKRRERAGESEVMNVIGECAGYTCILVDDIVDSGGTLVNAADALLANGAKDVYAYISHGVLSGGAPRVSVFEAEGARHHRLDPADGSGEAGAEHPLAVDRRPDLGGDPAHRGGRVGVEPVRLTRALLKTGVRFRLEAEISCSAEKFCRDAQRRRP